METTGLKYTSETEIAYLAGIFDGEGCLGYHGTIRSDTNKPRDNWVIELQMSDEDVVKRFADYIDNSIRICKKLDNRKQIWRTQTGKRDSIFRIVCDFYPYLSARRREKCDEFIAWYEAKQ